MRPRGSGAVPGGAGGMFRRPRDWNRSNLGKIGDAALSHVDPLHVNQIVKLHNVGSLDDQNVRVLRSSSLTRSAMLSGAVASTAWKERSSSENIHVSNRAESTLWYYHRRDAKTYEIIRRKTIDLSNGHFSYTTHKRRNRPNTEIPAYEAKMTGDLRLIYIVDCIASPTDNHVVIIFGYKYWLTLLIHDHSAKCRDCLPIGFLGGTTSAHCGVALKAYDFCTHAKMDYRLWDSVASHLQSQGKEYRLRCVA
ncbi:hypothetical protein CVT24_004351 [Panaeolus cyanescens]|uniref:Uncharacterized protein n=1 Tax=Panaeolus cyanescens TaxID=181874 RepID=A0A409X6M0_9AGAR|nr:hypothetical protein CVT24_004351 [Panaeolus cyanescens]